MITRNNKMNIPMLLACVLLCCVMISFHFVSGLYARYSTTSTGNSMARVAKFGEILLSETGNFYEPNKLMLIPGVDLTKDVNVDFEGSESATYLFVEIDLSNNWVTEDNETFAIKDGTTILISWMIHEDLEYVTNQGNKYIYCLTLTPSTVVNQDVLADNGKITVSNTITKVQMSQLGLIDISMDVQAHVVQIGEFVNAQAAWNSINTNYN